MVALLIASIVIMFSCDYYLKVKEILNNVCYNAYFLDSTINFEKFVSQYRKSFLDNLFITDKAVYNRLLMSDLFIFHSDGSFKVKKVHVFNSKNNWFCETAFANGYPSNSDWLSLNNVVIINITKNRVNISVGDFDFIANENDFRNNEQEVFNIVKKHISCGESSKTISIDLNEQI